MKEFFKYSVLPVALILLIAIGQVANVLVYRLREEKLEAQIAELVAKNNADHDRMMALHFYTLKCVGNMLGVNIMVKTDDAGKSYLMVQTNAVPALTNNPPAKVPTKAFDL